MNGDLGFTILFAGDFAPVNWALCNGSLLPIAQYRALFKVIGNTYGGDGIKTFALPDLRGRAVVGAGKAQVQGSTDHKPGEAGGKEAVQFTADMFPSHTHSLKVTITPKAASTANSPAPENGVYATGTNQLYNYGSADTFMARYDATITTTEEGGDDSSPVPILHPVFAMNYIICIST